MNKLPIILFLAVLPLLGCSDSYKPHLTTKYINVICVDGVSYLIKGQGITVMLDKDSKIIPCQ